MTPAPPTTDQPIVALSGIVKHFASGTLALDGLDLKIAPGEFVSLLGPSGCGKSTALRLIAGLAAPTSGTVEVSHHQGEARSAKAIGFVFQEPTLMPWTRVRENVRLPLTLTRAPATESDARVEAALARVGLTEFADSYPRELSGGMKMRVSLARALVTDPDILLMDEPFAALDEITRFRLNNDLLALWRNLKKTVIFVTHSIDEALLIGNRILVLSPHPGQVKAELNAGHLGFADLGTQPFELLSRRIHELLFADTVETALVNEVHRGA